MQITLTLPARIAREAEQFAREVGVPVSEFCVRVVEEYVKTMSQQRAIETIHAMLQSPVRAEHGRAE